jgi:hypothetical protein
VVHGRRGGGGGRVGPRFALALAIVRGLRRRGRQAEGGAEGEARWERAARVDQADARGAEARREVWPDQGVEGQRRGEVWRGEGEGEIREGGGEADDERQGRGRFGRRGGDGHCCCGGGVVDGVVLSVLEKRYLNLRLDWKLGFWGREGWRRHIRALDWDL